MTIYLPSSTARKGWVQNNDFHEIIKSDHNVYKSWNHILKKNQFDFFAISLATFTILLAEFLLAVIKNHPKIIKNSTNPKKS